MADVDSLVLGSVNASLRRPIDAATLLAALRDPAVARQWAAHLTAFFEDVPREAMWRFLLARGLDAAVARRAYRELLPVESDRDADLERWLGELADPS